MHVHDTTVHLAGETTSRDFPVTPDAYDRTYNGGDFRFGGDVFIARLNLGTTLHSRSVDDQEPDHIQTRLESRN
jgi:hypothetical protein